MIARDRRRLVRFRVWIAVISLDLLVFGLLVYGIAYIGSRLLP